MEKLLFNMENYSDVSVIGLINVTEELKLIAIR